LPGIICLGTQWGDEGKGKVTDMLADKMKMVVRYQGGNNAGHTVIVDNVTLKLHSIPSGILYPHIVNVIGDGLVVDPKDLIKEMNSLVSQGISTEKLFISGNCHLIMPYHKILDSVRERKLGKYKIGTTGKGIGPTYADKAARIGIRAQDLFDIKILEQKLEQALKEKNQVMTKLYNLKPLKAKELIAEYSVYAKYLKKRIVDTSKMINDALDRGDKVFFEGAQGTMLDIDHGSYPYVTSSSPVAGGACAGSGVGPLKINKVIGVTKAYTTRVGEGPFPTEQINRFGQKMQEIGGEVGTTTGRARRCGWFDAIVVKHAASVNSLSVIFLTKLDVLSSFKKIKIASAYNYRGKRYDYFPPHQTIFNKAKPEYMELDGWNSDISGITKYEKLPRQARKYVETIEKLVGVPIKYISVGPSRRQTIKR